MHPAIYMSNFFSGIRLHSCMCVNMYACLLNIFPLLYLFSVEQAYFLTMSLYQYIYIVHFPSNETYLIVSSCFVRRVLLFVSSC